MSPHEISTPGGSVEHYNEEAGITWMQRLTNTYPAAAWLNPVNENYWDYTHSIRMIREVRSEEHTSELQSLMRISYAVFCLKQKQKPTQYYTENPLSHNYYK